MTLFTPFGWGWEGGWNPQITVCKEVAYFRLPQQHDNN